jgi:Holliday junction resolvasome RuvABC DNA-binding subunit
MEHANCQVHRIKINLALKLQQNKAGHRFSDPTNAAADRQSINLDLTFATALKELGFAKMGIRDAGPG